LTTNLLTSFKQKIKDLKLIPAGGGCFEVRLNDDLVYSKLKTGQFPDEQAIVNAVASRLSGK
jgi:selenoprotein W-related protein